MYTFTFVDVTVAMLVGHFNHQIAFLVEFKTKINFVVTTINTMY